MKTLSRRRRCAFTIAVSALASCHADWAPSNPYDQYFPLEVRIVGPDTAYTLGDTLTFALQTTPAWSPEWPAPEVTWTQDGGLTSLGDGRFVVNVTEGEGPLTVRATVGPHLTSKSVFVRRRVARIRAYWCDGPGSNPIDVTTYAPFTFCVRYYDAANSIIDSYWLPTHARVVATNAAMVVLGAGAPAPEPVQVTPLADGSTYLRATYQTAGGGIAADSLAYTVRQRVAFGIIESGCYPYIHVGDTLRATVQWVDNGRVPMKVSPVTTGLSVGNWYPSTASDPPVATLGADGLITANATGAYMLTANAAWNDGWNTSQSASCANSVIP